MLRGGSWNNNSENAACAYRNNEHPHNRNNNVGFRCAKTPPAFAPFGGEGGRKTALSRRAAARQVMSRPPVQSQPGCGLDEDDYARWRTGVPVGRRVVFCLALRFKGYWPISLAARTR